MGCWARLALVIPRLGLCMRTLKRHRPIPGHAITAVRARLKEQPVDCGLEERKPEIRLKTRVCPAVLVAHGCFLRFLAQRLSVARPAPFVPLSTLLYGEKGY